MQARRRHEAVTDFLVQIIPTTVVGCVRARRILGVVLVSLLFGLALSRAGEKGKPLLVMIDSLTHAVFGIVNILMRFAPIGAFRAMAFTIGRYGLRFARPPAETDSDVLDHVHPLCPRCARRDCVGRRFQHHRFLAYIKEEIILVLSLSSSEPVLPLLMAKLERLGCSKALVDGDADRLHLNPDGSCLCMTMAALFVAQATTRRCHSLSSSPFLRSPR
jgi:aerobic C4-dicarboxylate transport protein